jgi:hypothetical protein
MTKQVELSNLLKAHRRAVYSHLDDASRSTGPGHTKVAASLVEVDKSEKRIFSLFDKLTKENEALARVIKDKSALIGELSRRVQVWPSSGAVGNARRFEVMISSPLARPFDPLAFNEAKARNGDAIQIKVREAMSGDPLWTDAKFVGVYDGSVVVDSARYGLEKVAHSDVRMKPTHKTVTLYANVRHGTAGYIGALYEDKGTAEKNAKNATWTGTPVAIAVPVKITVAA